MVKTKPFEPPVFDLSLVQEDLSDDAKRIMDTLQEKTAYISEYMTPIGKYDKTIELFANNLLYGFEHKEFRDFPICFKFRNDPDEEAKWLPYRVFIINMIFWRPQVCLDPDALCDEHIIPPSMAPKAGPKLLKDYIDSKYATKYNRHIPIYPNLRADEIADILNEVFGETTFILQQTVGKFSNFFGLSANIEIFKDLSDRNPEFNELMHLRLDEQKQPSEIEKDIKDARQSMVDLVIRDDRFNPLKPLMATNSLNIKQVGDMVISPALKPNFNGTTIPHVINTNYLAGGGLRNMIDYYIVAISGRKAAMINNEFMGKTGHLLILIAICTARATLSKTCLDCNTINPIPIEIKSEKHLVKMNGRRYKYMGERKYRILDANKDKHLIGQTLEFRSPITCACKDGICRECYGELYYTNIDNEVTGIYSATVVMNPVVQGILSAKHHQTTNTTPIVFNELFDEFFKLASTDVIIDVNENLDITEYCLVIRRDDIMTTDDEDLDLDFEKKTKRRKKKKSSDDDELGMDGDEGSLELSMRYYVTKFQVVKDLHTKGKTPVYYDFEEKDKKELFIHDDFINKMIPDEDEYGKYRYIELEDINPDEFIFLLDVENNELTKPMKEIQKVLNNKDHAGCSSYEEMANKMLDLMIASELKAVSVHAEMIIRELVRRKTNVLRRPDFSKLIMNRDIELMTINSALKKNPSITTSLSTPYLKDQLVNLMETFDKTAASIFDPLFKPNLVTEKDRQRTAELEAQGKLPTMEI